MADSRVWSIPGLQDWGDAFDMAYGNGIYLVIGDTNYAGVVGRPMKVWRSLDAVTWYMEQPIDVLPALDYMSFCNDRFYACSSTEKYESTDGLTWTVTTDFANPLMLVYSGGTYVGLNYSGNTFYGAHPASLTQILTVPLSGTKIKKLANGSIAVFNSARLWIFQTNTLIEYSMLPFTIAPKVIKDVESVGTKIVVAAYDAGANATTLYYETAGNYLGAFSAASWPGGDVVSLDAFNTLASDGTTIVAYNRGDTFGALAKHVYYATSALSFTAVNLTAVAPIYVTGLIKVLNGKFFYAGETSEGTQPSAVLKSSDGITWGATVTFTGHSTASSVNVYLPNSNDEAGVHPASYNVTLAATNTYGTDSQTTTINLTETP